ncbi:hypothetical protein [Aromatoleum evansii]|uniref:hypothetical protein n=1 Tax=Aromatoleum evansii TaxID=59406 RepID=UPI00145D716D|nr:hypothetical protein [Aromatoleum evansii]NMG27835.1 hypothetical protein [Aromatoleum evansii]
MTVYFDALMHNDWPMLGRPLKSGHLFSAPEDPDERHAITQAIRLKSRGYGATAAGRTIVSHRGTASRRSLPAPSLPVGTSRCGLDEPSSQADDWRVSDER